MENADGFAARFAPIGHEAVYFARIGAATPTKLRRCAPGELGSVIAHYQGIASYDWLAVLLIPYLYSVENASQLLKRVGPAAVRKLLQQYHDVHLVSLGKGVPEGGWIQRGWNQLVGAAYQRGMYVFWFRTTRAQDDAFIAHMNAAANHSRFNYFARNCADFAAAVLDFYFPQLFGRRILPNGGIVTPRQVAYELTRYARWHPELGLRVLEIPLVPGCRRPGRTGKSVAECLIVAGDIVPITVLNLYAAGAKAADYLTWGCYSLPLKHAWRLGPDSVAILADRHAAAQRYQRRGRQRPQRGGECCSGNRGSDSDRAMQGRIASAAAGMLW